MKCLKMLFLMSLTLIAGALNAFWKTLLLLIDFIDGGDEEEINSFPTDSNIHFNYRTGDIDPVKHLDGLYDNKP